MVYPVSPHPDPCFKLYFLISWQRESLPSLAAHRFPVTLEEPGLKLQRFRSGPAKLIIIVSVDIPVTVNISRELVMHTAATNMEVVLWTLGGKSISTLRIGTVLSGASQVSLLAPRIAELSKSKEVVRRTEASVS